MLDHYYSERTGPKYENQSTTEFKFCTHGSKVRTGRDQRVFFLLVRSRSRLRRSLSPQNKTKQNKKPSGTQGTCELIQIKRTLICMKIDVDVEHIFIFMNGFARRLVLKYRQR